MPTTNYIYHGNQYLCETDENDTPTKLYVNEPGTYTNLVSQKDLTTGEKSYPLYDALGSTRAVTDDNGNVTDTFVYDAWGNVLDRTGTTDIPFQYVGKHGYYRDKDTETIYVMARNYDSRIIRWLSIDPVFMYESQYHQYAYVSNTPNTAIDPTGLKKNWHVKGVAKSFINGLPRIGNIAPAGRKGAPLPPWVPVPILWPHPPTGTPSATERLEYLAGLMKLAKAPPFFQNPSSDAKDGECRLYTMIDVSFCCDNEGRITLSGYKKDMEGGIEFPSVFIPGILAAPEVWGTINMNQTVVNHGDKIIVWWKGWGKPNPLVESGMQWVARRTSVNIWHTVRLELRCEGEQGNYTITDFKHSKFPSHRLWVNRILKRDIAQKDFADLWNPLSIDPTFVE
jgi:RHS repeat-associated protein